MDHLFGTAPVPQPTDNSSSIAELAEKDGATTQRLEIAQPSLHPITEQRSRDVWDNSSLYTKIMIQIQVNERNDIDILYFFFF